MKSFGILVCLDFGYAQLLDTQAFCTLNQRPGKLIFSPCFSRHFHALLRFYSVSIVLFCKKLVKRSDGLVLDEDLFSLTSIIFQHLGLQHTELVTWKAHIFTILFSWHFHALLRFYSVSRVKFIPCLYLENDTNCNAVYFFNGNIIKYSCISFQCQECACQTFFSFLLFLFLQ